MDVVGIAVNRGVDAELHPVDALLWINVEDISFTRKPVISIYLAQTIRHHS